VLLGEVATVPFDGIGLALTRPGLQRILDSRSVLARLLGLTGQRSHYAPAGSKSFADRVAPDCGMGTKDWHGLSSFVAIRRGHHGGPRNRPGR
jgi:hypothetical protein